jgi:hypothetical protein
VDEPEKLYHSRSWASSIRTTSDGFAHIIGLEETEEGDTIGSIIHVGFPSEIVLYCCAITDCPCQAANVELSKIRIPGSVDPRLSSNVVYAIMARLLSSLAWQAASDILDFDVITHGRYHHPAEQMRK